MSRVNHDKAIRAANEHTKKQLPVLREAFNAFLKPGRYMFQF
jgi:hypothetical protein